MALACEEVSGRPEANTHPRVQAKEIQRARVLAAVLETIEDLGYAHVSVAEVIARARVSRKTFYNVFVDREDCCLSAFAWALERGRFMARDAYEREAGWQDGTRAALARLLAFMDQAPGLARFCVVDALGAGPRLLERRARAFDEMVRAIDRARDLEGASRSAPEVTAEGVVGGLFSVLHRRLLGHDDEPLSELVGPLMSIVVLPYLGTRAAMRELRIAPAPGARERRPGRPPRRADPLRGLNLRLTHRTVRVLMVIAQHPGASNRSIAHASGIVDQGQISKLLTRLARLELIDNRGGGQQRGVTNSWFLTRRGAQVERATHPQ
jgi:AcrR family transcriptional regulator